MAVFKCLDTLGTEVSLYQETYGEGADVFRLDVCVKGFLTTLLRWRSLLYPLSGQVTFPICSILVFKCIMWNHHMMQKDAEPHLMELQLREYLMVMIAIFTRDYWLFWS